MVWPRNSLAAENKVTNPTNRSYSYIRCFVLGVNGDESSQKGLETSHGPSLPFVHKVSVLVAKQQCGKGGNVIIGCEFPGLIVPVGIVLPN